MKKISNRQDLNHYFTNINGFFDDYLSHGVSAIRVHKYITQNMERFKNKYNLSEIEGIDEVIRQVAEHRRNMELDNIVKFEQFVSRIDENLLSISRSDVKHERVLADYYNSSIGHIELINHSCHLYKIEDFGQEIKSVIFSEEELGLIQTNVIDKIISELQNRKVSINSLDGQSIYNPIDFLLGSIIDETKLKENIESKLDKKTLIEIISCLLPYTILGSEILSSVEYKGDFKGYYIWEI